MYREDWQPIIFFNPPSHTIIVDQVDPAAATATATKVEEESSGLNLDYFMSDDATIKGQEDLLEKEMKKQERKAKREAAKTAQAMTPVDNSNNIATNTAMPYIDTYGATNNMLMGVIAQADKLAADVQSDIDTIRAAKSLKGKYTYLTNLTGAASSALTTKLTAIREINSAITQAHNLELKRNADLRKFESDKQNDDARMMDLYNAFINAPMGMYENPLQMPKLPEMMLGPNNSQQSGIVAKPVGQGPNTSGLQMTPEQYRMQVEDSGQYEEVVVYDPATGARWFDVVDKYSGQSVPNLPRSDSFLLEDITIETRAGIAKHRNLDKIWPLRTVGGANLTEY